MVEGAVQILTVHAAKGLEWDVVAVAGLTRGVWPGPVRNSDHWLGGLGRAAVPAARRRRRAARAGPGRRRRTSGAWPGRWTTSPTRWRAHDEREERRLAYVAVTRPRRLLLCSGYWWGEGTKRPRGPSVFLARGARRAAWTAGPGTWSTRGRRSRAGDAVEPDHRGGAPGASGRPTRWAPAGRRWPRPPRWSAASSPTARPAPPEGTRADRGAGPPGGRASQMAGRRRRWRAGGGRRTCCSPSGPSCRAGPTRSEVALPAHLSVSQLVALRRDPQALARALRRPLPAAPDPYARRGTAFHPWLEQRFGADRLLDLDELPGAADDDAAPDEALAELQERFLASEWADRVPVEVEVPFATVIAGVVVRGRMDAVFAAPGRPVRRGRLEDRPAARRAARPRRPRCSWPSTGWPGRSWPACRWSGCGAAFHYVRDGGDRPPGRPARRRRADRADRRRAGEFGPGDGPALPRSVVR